MLKIKKSWFFQSFGCVAFGMFCLAFSTANADVHFTDSSFASTDWTLSNHSCGSASISAAQQSSGGDSGYWRHYSFGLGPRSGDEPILVSFDKMNNATYTSSSDRAISTIYLKVNIVDYNDGNPHPLTTFCFVIKQDEIHYCYLFDAAASCGESGGPNGDDSEFETRPNSETPELCSHDLIKWNPEQCECVAESHPGFSPSGPEMEFGFGVYTAALDGNGVLGEGAMDHVDIVVRQGADFTADTGTVVIGSVVAGLLGDTYTRDDTY